MANARELWVQSEFELSGTIDRFVVQGFSVATRDATSVTLVKRKSFSIVWALVGFFLCLLPLLIYLVVYVMQQDEVVFVRLAAAPAPQMSPDRRFWWDGHAWQDANALAPPAAQRTPDGTMWWDGVEWRPVRRAIG